jgi:arabinofuranosyltransferase
VTSSGETRALLWRYGALLGCAAVLVWHSLQYNFVTDDAYISFVYARNLAEHGALVFNPGDPVEGFTSFLWTFVLGLLMLIGLPPEITSLVLGAGFGVGTLAVALFTVEYLVADVPGNAPGAATDAAPGAAPGQSGPRRIAFAAVAPALLALSAGFACWSSGGLETQMFTFWVALALYAYARGREEGRWLRFTGVLLALCAMTRPEGLLVTALVGVHRLSFNVLAERRLIPSRDELVCLAGFLALWAPWYAWRWWYYGYPFPNTYYVKASGEPPPGYTAALMKNGLYYVWQWARQTGALFAAPVMIMGLVWARPGSRRFYYGTLAFALAAAYLGYAVKVGGDFMGLHRFIMPVFVIAAVAMALGVHALAARLARVVPGSRRGWLRDAALALIVTALLVAFASNQIALTRESLRWGNWQSDHGIDTPAYLRIYTLDRAAIGEHMRECFRPGDLSIVGGAGAQPYKGRMRAIDVFGLVSEKIAHEVPPTNPRAGHNKWGPNELLLGYEPTFVFSCYAIHTRPDNPRFNCAPGWWLSKGYEVVTLHIPTLQQQGTYYSFLKRKDRLLECPGLLK